MSHPHPTREELARFATEGFVIAPALLSPEECATFLERNRAYYDEGLWSGLDTHMRDDRFDGIVAKPSVLAWARALLEGPIACVQTLVFAKPPGSKGLSFHQESYYVETDPPGLLTCWVALDDADAGNGGLTLVPGSHLMGKKPVRLPTNRAEHVEMCEVFDYHGRDGQRWQKTLIAGEIADVAIDSCVTPRVDVGTAIFFDGYTIHGSSKNHSKARSRHAFSAHYIRQDTWVYRVDISQGRVFG